MFKSINEMQHKPIEINLTGPDGNAFVLLGMAKNFAKQLGKDVDAIQSEMMEDDYEHLLNVFEREFGAFVVMYR
jgi:hypothetical protein